MLRSSLHDARAARIALFRVPAAALERATLVHTAVAALGALELIRTLHQAWVRLAIREEPALLAFVVALPVASALASIIAIVLGARAGLRRRALVTDLATLGSAYAAALLLSLPMGPNARGVVGLLRGRAVARCAVARAHPAAASTGAVFALARLLRRGCLVGRAATAAQGDQPHYLLAADRLARGSPPAPAYADGTFLRRAHRRPPVRSRRYRDARRADARRRPARWWATGSGARRPAGPRGRPARFLAALVAAFTSLQTCGSPRTWRTHATPPSWRDHTAPLPTLAGIHRTLSAPPRSSGPSRLLHRGAAAPAKARRGTVLLTPHDAVVSCLRAVRRARGGVTSRRCTCLGVRPHRGPARPASGRA